MRLALEATNDSVWEVDLRANTVWVSPRWYTMLGYPARDPVMSLEEFRAYLHPDDRPLAADASQRAIRDGVPYAVEARLRAADGSWRWLQARGRVSERDANGVATRLSGVNTDIDARRLAEAAREESQSLARDVLDSVANQIAVLDGEGNILAANQGWMRFAEESGAAAPATGFVGSNYLRVLDSSSVSPEGDDAAASAAGIRAVLAGEATHFECEYPCHSPTRQRWFRMRVTPLTGRRGGAVVSHLEITSGKVAEEALRTSEARFRAVVEHGTEGILFGDAQGTIIYRSPSFSRITGHPDEDRVGQSAFRFVHADDQPRVFAHFERVRADAALGGEVQFRYQHGDGSWRWMVANVANLLEHPGVRAIVCACRDVTDRVERELEVARKNALLDRVGAMAKVGGADLDLRTGVVYWTAEMCRILEVEPDQIPPLDRWSEFFEADALRQFQAAVEAMTTSGIPLDFETEMVTAKGRRVWVRIRSTAEIENGQVVRLISAHQDVSERKAAEEERSNLEAQLRQAQKLESVGRLAGGVAHDFNNMLGVILGVSETAMQGLAPGNALLEHLHEIHDAAQRSADLTRQLLTFARQQVVAPTALDLNETVERSVRLLKRLIGENIALEWRPGAGLWRVFMDPSQVDQILANLSVNARDAIADVGTLTIATDNAVVDARFAATHADATPGEYVRLTVRDSGQGMTPEVAARVFEPFFTTKGVGEGTGLGLATVHGAVRQNGGFITVSSAPEQGTAFEIHLPRLVGEAVPVSDANAEVASTQGHETILVVEDEGQILRMVTRTLEGQGYTVLAAAGPAAALERLASHAGAIDLLVTDVVMPGMNGRALAAAVRARHPQVKYLFMSGFPAGTGPDAGVVMDPDHFIAKPFRLKAFATAVRRVLDREA
jgi:PAS domain S-box-containing protein